MAGVEELLSNNPDPNEGGGLDFGNPGGDPPAPEPAPTSAPAAPDPEPTGREILAALTGLQSTMEGRFAENEAAIAAAVAANRQPDPANPAPAPGEEGWTPKSWDDFPALVEKMGREAAEKVLSEREDAAKQQNDQVVAVQKQIDDEIDKQTDELVKNGRIPSVTDEKNPKDPGKVARRELYGLAAWAGTPDLSRAQDMLDHYHKAGYSFDVGLYQADKDPLVRSNPSAPGKFAPVGSSSAAAGGNPGAPKPPTYKDIASARSMDELIDRFGSQYQ